MHVSLTEVLDEYVKKQVASGLYNNASEVMREALRLKMRFDASERAKLEALRRDVDTAWRQADRGEFEPFDVERFLAELDREKAVEGGAA